MLCARVIHNYRTLPKTSINDSINFYVFFCCCLLEEGEACLTDEWPKKVLIYLFTFSTFWLQLQKKCQFLRKNKFILCRCSLCALVNGRGHQTECWKRVYRIFYLRTRLQLSACCVLLHVSLLFVEWQARFGCKHTWTSEKKSLLIVDRHTTLWAEYGREKSMDRNVERGVCFDCCWQWKLFPLINWNWNWTLTQKRVFLQDYTIIRRRRYTIKCADSYVSWSIRWCMQKFVVKMDEERYNWCRIIGYGWKKCRWSVDECTFFYSSHHTRVHCYSC